MTFPDPNLERPLGGPRGTPENQQDVVPRTERNQDPLREGLEQGLSLEGSRPLTDDEKKMADRDAPVGERVYAPASERVPVEPVPGHRDFIEHPDTHTPEREAAAGLGSTSATRPMGEEELSFARVARPSTTPTATPGAYGSSMSNPAFGGMGDDGGSSRRTERRRTMFMGIGFSWLTVLASGVGLWLFMRWRRERNKPINRLRRQAMHAASELREHMPDPEDAARPVMGLTTALLSMLVVLWQQTQTRSRRASRRAGHHADKTASRASQAMSDADWHKRLTKLKERWTPGRLELEKISISRH
jgi:hypothetical protein